MIDDDAVFRSKEQVLYDLSEALHFSPESLELNRSGKLSKDQRKLHARRCITPAVLAVVLLLAPLPVWTSVIAKSQEIPFGAAFLVLLHQLTHFQELIEAHGKMGGLLML